MKIFLLAHLFIVADGGNSLPVVGTPTSALIFALFFTAAILGLYLIVDHLPKVKKNRITPKNEPAYAKAMIAIIIGIIGSVAWDIWWHQTIGRDRLLIPPHIFVYGLIALGALISFYVWRHCRDVLWKHLTFALLLVVVGMPYDNFWHSIYGVEDLRSPIRLAWAPPHAFLGLSVIAALLLSFLILLRFRKTVDFSFFGNLALGGIMATTLALLMPFNPTEGWGAVAGFAGTVVWAFVFVSMCFIAKRVMRGQVDATFMTIIAVMLIMIEYGKDIAPRVQMLPHDRPPVWLFMFSFLVAAILLDLTQNIFQTWTRGLFTGTVWATILFGFSSFFFLPQFQYGLPEIVTAITFAALGGLLAGSLASLHHLTDEKHIEKLLKKF